MASRLPGTAPIALAAVVAATLLTTTGQRAHAQEMLVPRAAGWELVVPAGTLIPTGAQRDAFARGGVTAVQVSYRTRPTLAFTTTLGWARSRDIVSANRPKVDVFLVDVGTEVRAARRLESGSWSLSPFASLGAGARAYSHRADDSVTPRAAGYGGAGAELGFRRVRLRLEARDYVSGSGGTGARNDVMALIGLRLASRS